ncbi:terminase small subunit [Lacticaseibacillus parakribbianus]|uniref:terminase small subunit n=1 Tax=Lacticaseibacillus parakribbianus TaxID=2970927 RepID=UPI0021CB8B55|nr:terminase small subunit [Lacticaseibacillus parakribbianus]
MTLKPKQQRFVDNYVQSGNAYQAAVSAGYSKAYAKAQSSKMLENVGIKSAIEKRMAELESEKIANADEVLQYLTTVLRGEASETIVVGTGDGAEAVDNSPSIKDRMAAGRELLKRYPGTDKLLDARTRQTEAAADIAEMQRDELKGIGYKNPLIEALAKGAAALLAKGDDKSEDKRQGS